METETQPDPAPAAPTITRNRIVDFYPSAGETAQTALVVWVHSPTMVNLVTWDGNGFTSPKTSVPFVQSGDEVPGGMFASWPER